MQNTISIKKNIWINMELTIEKIEEICQDAIKELTKEVKLPDTNLSLVGICIDKINPNPATVVGCGIYSPSHEDVIMLW